MTAETLLATKLHIPAARPDAVGRARLVAALDEGLRLGHRLTLVSAPPGFGKTVLIREWIETLPRPTAWLTLDESDGDAGRLARYVIAALAQASDGVRQAAAGLSPPASPQELAIAAINSLAATGAELVLVMDDYHAIRELQAHSLVAFFLANQPPGLHLVIGTREDPPLPLARLRALDQVTEVRERALRFTQAEATAFLNQTMRLGLSAASVALLAARTEGWIAGLQLAGLALRQAGTADEFVAAFAGDDRYIMDYMMAEVLDRIPEPLRVFLRQTSILDCLCAPLCAALTGRDDSQAILEELEAANLFVVSLDNRREWYRYHVLFAEVLRLTLTGQEQIELHTQAAAWFQAHGSDDLAAHHARLAAQIPTAPTPALLGAPGGQRPAGSQALVEPLSERELEVLRLIAAGFSNQEIAGRLVIAPSTVKRHINNIYGKLHVGSRTQAVAVARSLHIL